MIFIDNMAREQYKLRKLRLDREARSWRPVVDDEKLFDTSPLWLARSAYSTNGNSQD